MRRALAILLMLLVPLAAGADATSTHYMIIDPTLAPGGTASSAHYQESGTVGETAHGTSSSSSFKLNWPGFFAYALVTAPVPSAQVGNESGTVNLSWSASVGHVGESVSGYQVGKATSSGGPYAYTSVGNVLTYDYGSLTNGTPYYFVIVALDQASRPVATSTEVSATPLAPTLTFVTDSGNESFPSLTPGQLVSTSSILAVMTPNSTGFIVSAARSNSSATLTLNGNTGVVIPDKTDWSAPGATTTSGNATASTTQPQTLQFRLWAAQTDAADYASAWWGSGDTTAGALFAGIPASTQTIADRSVSAGATSTLRVLYNVNVPSTQNTGTYSGDVVYSVTANP